VAGVGFVGIHYQLCPCGITEVFFKLGGESESLFGRQNQSLQNWTLAALNIPRFVFRSATAGEVSQLTVVFEMISNAFRLKKTPIFRK
jgi:hypothetical protein